MTAAGRPFNPAGMTVYVFDLDLTAAGHSLCNASNGCSQNWPPVAPPAGVALSNGFSSLMRTPTPY